jgi:hypothetical protein
MMNWKRCGRKRSWPNLRYYLCICLERLSKTSKNLSQDSLSPGQGLNPRLSEYEVGDTPVKHADGQKRPNCSSIFCAPCTNHSICIVRAQLFIKPTAHGQLSLSRSSYYPIQRLIQAFISLP